MARKAIRNKVIDNSQVRALNPSDPDAVHYGDEPLFAIQPDTTERKSVLARSLNWYSRFYGRKEAKDLLCQYLDLSGHVDKSKIMRKVDESDLNPSLCWLARMTLRGLTLTETESATLQSEITKLIKNIQTPADRKVSQTGGAKEKTIVKEVNRPNVQEIMRDKAREAAGEIEGLFDEFIKLGAPAKNSLRPMDEVAKKNVLPQHIPMLIEVWKKRQDEFEELQKGKDAQLVQAYSHLSKIQVRNIVKFIEQVLSDLNSYISVKKAAKSPRKRKPVSIEKQVSKLKFLKEFKDAANKLDLVGLHPVKLQGASEAWVYDTAKRKLHHFIADEYSKEFTVKGNTLLGFDTKNSEVKNLRKPGEQLKEIMGSKPAARKYFKDIRAVATTPKGRFNADMIILRAF